MPTLREDASQGLLQPPRRLPPKYFYDEPGSQLFDQICDTPQYYLTRTEDALLAEHARKILRTVRPEHMIELGSGASRKTRRLLDACVALRHYCTYWPFDVCEPMVRQAGEALLGEYPWLSVQGLIGDYLAGFEHMPRIRGRRLFLFLGSTIGNLDHDGAVTFLGELCEQMAPGDYLLLGFDRHKDPAVVHAAYNDEAGLTAKFNLNVLRVLNRELAAEFNLQAFSHLAHYDSDRRQIEMHLVADDAQRIPIGALGVEIRLEAGERIQTEISRKFTPRAINELLHASGLSMESHFEPSNAYFSLVLAHRA